MKKLFIIALFVTISTFCISAMEIDDKKSDADKGLRKLFKIQRNTRNLTIDEFDEYSVNEIDPFSTETFSDLIKEAERNKTSLIIARGLQSIGAPGKTKEFTRTYEAVRLFRHLFGPNFISPKKHRANISEQEQTTFEKTDPLSRQPLLGTINLFSIDNNDQTGTYIGSDLQLHKNQGSEKATVVTDALLSTISNEILIDEYFTNAKELFQEAQAAGNIEKSHTLYRQALEYFVVLELKLNSLQQEESDLADIKKYLGKIYLYGLGGVEKNTEQGLEYLKAVSDQDANLPIKVKTQFNLGLIYLYGKDGVEKNIEQGLEYLKAITDQDANLSIKVKAQYNLGLMYFYGQDGVEKSVAQGLKYLQAAANQNDNLSIKAKAQFDLGQIHFYGQDNVEKSIKKSLEYLKTVVNQDSNPCRIAKAQFNLGLIYFYGLDSIEKNIELGIEYLEMVADQEDDLSIKAEAQFNLGIICFEGMGGDKNVAQGLKHLKVVANQADNPSIRAEAQFNLGEIYFCGEDNIEKEIELGLEYLEAAANQNDNLSAKAEAQDFLDKC